VGKSFVPKARRGSYHRSRPKGDRWLRFTSALGGAFALVGKSQFCSGCLRLDVLRPVKKEAGRVLDRFRRRLAGGAAARGKGTGGMLLEEDERPGATRWRQGAATLKNKLPQQNQGRNGRGPPASFRAEYANNSLASSTRNMPPPKSSTGLQKAATSYGFCWEKKCQSHDRPVRTPM